MMEPGGQTQWIRDLSTPSRLPVLCSAERELIFWSKEMDEYVEVNVILTQRGGGVEAVDNREMIVRHPLPNPEPLPPTHC